MSSSYDILLFVVGFGVLQAVLLAGFIYFHTKSDHSVNRFLAVYILLLIVPMLIRIVQQMFSWQHIMYLLPFTLLIGPFLYFYVLSFKETITLKKAWPHFIMFFVFIGVEYYYYLRIKDLYPFINPMPPQVLSGRVVMGQLLVRNLQLLVYFFLAGRALKSYQKSIRHLFSETSKISLGWVRWLINGYLMFVVLITAMSYLMVTYPERYLLIITTAMALMTPYIYLVTFKSITQPTLWQLRPGLTKEKVEEEMHEAEEIEKRADDKLKNAKTGLSREKINEIAVRVTALMEHEKMFRDTDLTLQQLSDKIALPSYQVSQAINEGIQKNFYDLINGYRVDEAKRMLTDPKNQNFKIMSVAFDAGFSSKTTFNTVFKKFTGYTPTEFRDQQKVPEETVHS